MLNKMGLSVNFPRTILHARKTAIGIGLMDPSVITDALAMKLCLEHKRKNDEVATIIRINKKNAKD